MGYQLQRTAKGEFYQWHVDAGPGPLSQRQLVAIWYLNSLPAGEGQTEFFHQDVSVRPETGALLLFPPLSAPLFCTRLILCPIVLMQRA